MQSGDGSWNHAVQQPDLPLITLSPSAQCQSVALFPVADYATHAPHSPANPAPWYESGTACDHIRAPRLPNFNYSGPVRTACSRNPPTGPGPFGNDSGNVWWFGGTNLSELTSCQPYFNEEDVFLIDQLA